MITDKMILFDSYKTMIPFFKKIKDFLGASDFRNMPKGKYEIAGNDIYMMIQEYETENENKKKWESHKKYIDIQVMINGLEYIGCSSIDKLTILEPYNEEMDVIYYKESEKDYTSIVLKNEEFCIFFPNDGHKPGYYINEPAIIKKAVIKVKL